MRRCFVLTVVFLGALGISRADTHVPAGNVSGTWTLAGSPYIIDGEIAIQVGYTLTVQPGVQVIFSDNYKFNVYGRLLAVGSETDTVLFTAQDAGVGWNGLRFVDSNTNGQDSSKVVYCRIERGKPPAGASGSDLNGGGIYFESSSDILVGHCFIRKNYGKYGGGIYLDSSDVNVEDTRIDSNTTWQGGDGAGIYATRSNPRFTRVTVSGNYALESGYTGGNGGGMYFTHSVPTLREVDVLDNLASAYYGGIGGGLYLSNCTGASLRDVVVSGNEAIGADDGGYAGGIRVGSSDLSLERVTISGNEAGMYGGGMYLSGSSLELEKVTVVGNAVVHESGLCGGIYRTGSGILTIQSCVVWGNNKYGLVVSDSVDATYSDIQLDSGIYPGTGNFKQDPLFVAPIDSTQAPTTSGDFGLRWDYYPSGSTPKSPCIDSGDPSPLYDDPDSTRSDVGAWFFDQRYVSGNWPLAYSPYLVDHEITVSMGEELEIDPGTEVLFLGHHKFNVQGRLLAEGTGTDSIRFTAQDTSIGWHGLRFDDIDDNGQDSSRISYCMFEYGKATGTLGSDRSGGAIYFVNSSDVSVEHCLFEHNLAGYGGAIACAYSSDPRFEDVIVQGNEASEGVYNYGGGLYCATNSNPSLTRVLIGGNASTDEGGGLYLYGSSPTLTNVTISGNAVVVSGSGGGLYGTNGSYPAMTNSVHWNNDPSAISLSSSSLTATYSDLQEYWPGTGNINADPLFVSPADPSEAPTIQGDYHLTASSPCVDSGNPSPQYNDPDGTRNDMGAFYYDQYVYPPTADFDADTTIGWEPLSVNFTDLSAPGTGAIVSWKWYFGDGDSSSLQNPSHVYADTGTYTVTLIVVDENDSTDTRIKGDYITVIEFGHVPGGDVRGTWYLANSPYIIDGEITVQEGDELVIEPGVEVIFSGHYKFNIYGRLVAQGTEYERILYTAENHTTGWGGLRFYDQDYNGQPNSLFEYCRIEYGRATGGAPDNCGGGIYASNSSSLTLDHTLLCNNYAAYRGGGLYCSHSDYMEPRNVTFSKNVASQGGAIYCEATALYLQSCILWDDTNPEVAEDAYSSVIAYYSDIDSSIVFPGVENINDDPLFADPGGGDFSLTWANFPTPDATMSPCIDTGDPNPQYDDPDLTRNDMGALYFDQALGTIVPGGTVSGTWTLLESPYLIAGEISIPEDSTLVIEPGVCVNFQGHYKFNVYGQILAEGTEADSILFTADDTTAGWGGLRFWLTDSTAQDSSRLLHCRLEYARGSGSAPDNRGGAVFCDSSSALRVGHCRFVRDSAHYGGAMSLWHGSNPVVHDCEFVGNVAAYVGGAIHAHYSSRPSLSRCVFEDNYDQGGGGGAVMLGASSDADFSLCTFTRDSSNNAGGAIYCNSSHPTLDRCVFRENWAYYYGGAIYLYSGSNPTIENSTFYGNVAHSDHGGGIFINSSLETVVHNCIFWANQTSQIYLNYSTATVSYSDVQGGFAGTGNVDGDPLFADPGNGDFSLTWTNFPIEDSTKSPCIDAGDPMSPLDPDGTQADMGALPFDQLQGTYVPPGAVSGTWTAAGNPYLVYGDISIETGTRSGDSLVIEPGVEIVFLGHYKFNVHGRLLAIGTRADSILFTAQDTVEGWWGLRFLDSNTNGQDSSKVVYCRIEYGRATGTGSDNDGGGILCYNSSDVLIRDCMITRNSAESEGQGGGIACQNGSNPRIESVLICGNRTDRLGGGISCYSGSSPTIVDVIVSDNVAEGYYGVGGGVSCYGGSAPSLSRVLVRGNYTDYDGGGIYVDGSSTVLDRVTMVDNASVGNAGGMLIMSSTVTATNGVFRDNLTHQVISISSTLDLTYSNVENGWTGTGNIDEDPFFADTANGDYRLTWESYPVEDSTKSPCIDTGDPASSLDPDGTRADMGAFFFKQWIPTPLSPADSSLISDDTPLFVWSSTAGDGGFYVLQCATDTGFTDLVIHAYEVTETTYVHGSPLPDTTYYWHVEAVDSIGAHSGYPLHPFMFALDSETPDVPVLLAPEDSSVLEVNPPTFTWGTVAREGEIERITAGADPVEGSRLHSIQRTLPARPGHTKTVNKSQRDDPERHGSRSGSPVTYTLQCSEDSLFGDQVIDTSGLTSTGFTPPDSFVGGTYYWRVEATDEAGNHSGYQTHPFMFEVRVELCGDVNGDGVVTTGDGFHVLNYFGAGPAPVSCWSANVNGDGGLTTGDGFHLLNYFGAGPALDCAPCEF